MTSAVAENDPELDRFLDEVKRHYNSDAGFKQQVRDSVKQQSESYLKKVVEQVIGAVGAAILKGLMKALTRLFR